MKSQPVGASDETPKSYQPALFLHNLTVLNWVEGEKQEATSKIGRMLWWQEQSLLKLVNLAENPSATVANFANRLVQAIL